VEFYSDKGDTIDHFVIIKDQDSQISDSKDSLHQIGYNNPLKRNGVNFQ
jgi:hypothetical protein